LCDRDQRQEQRRHRKKKMGNHKSQKDGEKMEPEIEGVQDGGLQNQDLQKQVKRLSWALPS
jgi:hypothetical protein